MFPSRIVAEHLHSHVSPRAVTTGKLHRQAGEGSKGVRKLRIVSPQTKDCMQPIEVPRISRR